MRIGIYFTAGKNNGGVFQYSFSFLESLAGIKGNEYVIISTSPDIPPKFFHDKRFSIINLATPTQSKFESRRTYLANVLGTYVGLFIRILYKLRLFFVVELAMRYSQRSTLRTIREAKLDLLIFPAGSDLSHLVKVPTIVAIHDLQHRLNPQFKEVSAGGRWEYRENYYSKTCKKAVKILVDSKVGKEDVLNCYPNTDPDKIVIVPFLPNPYLNINISPNSVKRILGKSKITSEYIYYPAHFWSHKNHLVLIEALHLLHQKGFKVSLITTGSKDVDFSTYSDLKKLAQKYKISKYFKFLGYVSNNEVTALYKGALALTMPTYFGPTNIPVIEAWSMGTPVIYSDIRGCRDQLGTAGILANPDKPQEWVDAIEKLSSSKSQAQSLVVRGKKKLAKWQYKDFQAKITSTIKSITKSSFVN